MTVANYTRGYRHDGKSDLYHLMPLNGKLQLVHELDKWSNQVTVHLVLKERSGEQNSYGT